MPISVLVMVEKAGRLVGRVAVSGEIGFNSSRVGGDGTVAKLLKPDASLEFGARDEEAAAEVSGFLWPEFLKCDFGVCPRLSPSTRFKDCLLLGASVGGAD
ncbi:hypothetical protein F0L74_21515 [Chitinophaga agrisoli]|uniref:Uncharacterized protein n=1 Tax=Chitinophaga agrisoli TaxID=2607653 RepID=A0A5B2VJS4_9BACT|nr:hypothetical protein [Chitinophaga agrisoli]KAA2238796.1 hypothetical protein F0L74_21515 [Chitinophaga agrisoli]